MGLFRRKKPAAAAPSDRPYPTRDGTWVRSWGEQCVANWLSRQGIRFEYEPRVLGLRPDFLLPDHHVVIEYFGGAAWRRYEDRMVTKVHRYESAGYEVVALMPAHDHELESELARRLRQHGVPVSAAPRGDQGQAQDEGG